ncbi:hypothetical protein [Methylovulum psychrotolerans]|jgi:hypothetical protein|uniref:Uncharacterized protein n=1 Tax=Methylovulum psychrotolerans TaxID=1704499 RepID=A0A1Z4C3P5_9GAMM|nr:hypothetical protein [Methylovulum psychrotolerans]ASF48166.1 hypothetical protein CEK71_20025 [Methylovulum psychrotolerans]MBT9096466.1 hypothetical protein [Methylovulum psychrotolerans]
MHAYFFNGLIALDQLLNVLVFNGMPDETISARSFREKDTSVFWRLFNRAIDTVFLRLFGIVDHSQAAFVAEMQRLEMPKCYQMGVK